MSLDFERLMKHLREKTAEVELDVPWPPGSAVPVAAIQVVRQHQEAIRRGDRVAYVYRLVDGKRPMLADGEEERAELETGVTENECRVLLAAGARWIGPPAYMPTPRQYVEYLRVKNFRCIKEVVLALTPLHALIGPNDSGKSTLLEAIGTFSGTGTQLDRTSEVTASWKDHELTNTASRSVAHRREGGVEDDEEIIKILQSITGPTRILRLDPDEMRQPTNLIAHGSPLEYSPRGRGLAAVYDALLSRRLDAFLEISRRFTTLFPTARSIQLTNPSQTTKALGVELTDGRSVGAAQLSEGMLYWLAFAALPYLQPTPLLLIEEPENGLHPSRIGDVMQVLREVSNTSAQILIATHHPLVINELQPDEVTVITRPPDRGTIATPLSKTKNYEQRSKVYALGELWLNYADGNLESDLVGESTIPAISAG